MKQLLYLKDNQLKEFIEKLFVSYRETFADTKKILDKHNLGIAHQKVLHLISQYHGITISELLGKLKVTKQSLICVLSYEETIRASPHFLNLQRHLHEFALRTTLIYNAMRTDASSILSTTMLVTSPPTLSWSTFFL